MGDAPSKGSARVLLVDDARALRFTLRTLLIEAGYAVEEAATLRAARECLVHGTAFQAVILDRFLPDGNGLELVPELRRCCPAARIVLLTALPEDPVEPNLVDAVVAKTTPFERWEAQLHSAKG